MLLIHNHGGHVRSPGIEHHESRKVPLRRANVSYRSREYLSDKEVATLMTAAACHRPNLAMVALALRPGWGFGDRSF